MSTRELPPDKACEQFKQRSTDNLIELALTAGDMEDDPGWTAIWVLRERATREVFDAAKVLCESNDTTKRRVGVDILAQLGIPKRVFLNEIVDLFCKLIATEQDVYVLNSLGVGFGHLSSEPRKVEPLIKLMHHSDPQVRFAVAFGLSGEESPSAIQALIALSADEDDDVRDWATFALGSQTDLDSPQIREALLNRANDPQDHSNAPGEGLVGLARRRDERTVELILKYLRAGHTGTLVLEACEILADPRLYPELMKLRDDPAYEAYERHSVEEAIIACTPA